MNKDQLRELITEVLKDAGLYSAEAVELLMLTAAVESKLGYYIKQIKGPALGVFQMEPRTHDDLWDRFLAKRTGLSNEILKYGVQCKAKELKSNLGYAILMSRVYYLQFPEPIPTDLDGWAKYWKKYYNTELGAGTVDKAIKAYKELC